jgi:hypothetical protein
LNAPTRRTLTKMKEPSIVLHDHYTFSIQKREIETHYIQGGFITPKMEKGDESRNSIYHEK